MKKVIKNKKLWILGILIVGVFLLLISRITYAYLAQTVEEAQKNITVDVGTVDTLKFIVGDPLKLNATPTTLPENGTNLVSSTTAKASLTANDANNTVTTDYYFYFNITENTFKYTETGTPEIILTILDPDNNPLTDISGLSYGTFNGVSGFDITEVSGNFFVGSRSITSNSSTNATIQEWNISITYLNLPIDQSGNYGKKMTTEVQMRKEKAFNSTLANYIKGLYTNQGTNNLYHHDGTLTNGINDGSYRYAGAYESVENWVCFGSNVKKCPDDNLYRIIGVFNEKILNEDGTDSGKTEERVKLIKAYESTEESIGFAQQGSNIIYSNYKGKLSSSPAYRWSGSIDIKSNDWTISTFNKDILNGTYITRLGNDWSNKIATTQWKVGGNTQANISEVAAKNTYQNEIVNPQSGSYGNNKLTYNAKIGLMYVSDYGFAASQDGWSSIIFKYDNETIRNNNWMFLGVYEWTITRGSEYPDYVFDIYSSGLVQNLNNSITATVVARPTFYLNASEKYGGGTGTSTDPYRIA